MSRHGITSSYEFESCHLTEEEASDIRGNKPSDSFTGGRRISPSLRRRASNPNQGQESRTETIKRRKHPNLDIFGTAEFRKQSESRSESLSRKNLVVNFQDLIPRPKLKGKKDIEKIKGIV